MLLDLTEETVHQADMLEQLESTRDKTRLMEAMDSVNARYGKSTLHVASTGRASEDEAGWRMKQERRTPRYTTNIHDIPIARC